MSRLHAKHTFLIFLLYLTLSPLVNCVRPTIGIFSQRCPEYYRKLARYQKQCPRNLTTVQGAYVDFIRSGGGKVLLIPDDTDPAELEALILMNKLHGFLLSGGPDGRVPYYELAMQVTRWNLDGKYNVPILGICMGFEVIMMEAAKQ